MKQTAFVLAALSAAVVACPTDEQQRYCASLAAEYAIDGNVEGYYLHCIGSVCGPNARLNLYAQEEYLSVQKLLNLA